MPIWRRDGREVFYIEPDRSLMAVPVSVKGTTLDAGLPRPLFGPILAVNGLNYAVSDDGTRIFTYIQPGARTAVPITLIQHWRPGQSAATAR